MNPKHSKYRFPSGDFHIPISAIEKKYLGRKTGKKYEPISLSEIIIAVVLGGIAAGLILSIIVLGDIKEARAEEPQKTNQEYCSEFLEGKWFVAEEDKDAVVAYCANI